MKRIAAVIGVELYALALAMIQHANGVRTDEAKYLLDIPYPHPPLVRWILGRTDGWAHHELLWRIVFATIVVQAGWFLWDIARNSGASDRYAAYAPRAVMALWLLSAPVVAQSGTVMMAPLTAVQAIFFFWLLTRESQASRAPGLVALAWLASLFTAYQIALFAPVVAGVFRRMNVPAWQKAAGFGIPIVLLVLYTLTNPLIPASMFAAGTQNAGWGPLHSLSAAVRLWIIAGSAVLSVLGVLAVIRGRQWLLASCLVLLVAYISLSYRPYYAILFVPVLVGSLAAIPSLLRRSGAIIVATAIITVLHVFSSAFPLVTKPGVARSVIGSIREYHADASGGAPLLIRGSFGHEWQYESPWPVRRYREDLLPEAVAVVCLEPCADIPNMQRVPSDGGAEVWVR